MALINFSCDTPLHSTPLHSTNFCILKNTLCLLINQSLIYFISMIICVYSLSAYYKKIILKELSYAKT